MKSQWSHSRREPHQHFVSSTFTPKIMTAASSQVVEVRSKEAIPKAKAAEHAERRGDRETPTRSTGVWVEGKISEEALAQRNSP